MMKPKSNAKPILMALFDHRNNRIIIPSILLPGHWKYKILSYPNADWCKDSLCWSFSYSKGFVHILKRDFGKDLFLVPLAQKYQGNHKSD